MRNIKEDVAREQGIREGAKMRLCGTRADNIRFLLELLDEARAETTAVNELLEGLPDLAGAALMGLDKTKTLQLAQRMRAVRQHTSQPDSRRSVVSVYGR